ncbi:MAG: hypothetical protein AB1611_21355 [bacterium]
MLNKPYLSVQPKGKDNIRVFRLFVNTLVLALIFGTTVRIEYAHGYYGVPGNSYYQPSASGYYNTGNTYSGNTYTGYPYSYNSNSYTPSSYYSNTSAYSTASPQSYYYQSGYSPSSATAYTTPQSSFYYPNSYAAQSTYSPYTSYTSSAAQGYYAGGSSGYYAASNNSYYAGSYAPAANGTSYYYPAGATYSPSAATTYYRGPYSTAGSTTYYPAAQTYYPAAAGYTTAAVTDITGSYQGRWVRNYSSTGAPTSGRTTNTGSMRSSNGTTSATAGTCGGGGGGNGTGFQPITLELTQVAAAVNGTVTFFSDNSVVKTIPVNGTLESGGILNLNGTTAGSVSDPILYGIKITATVQGTSLQGAYTLTNTATGTNIELGTFSASK